MNMTLEQKNLLQKTYSILLPQGPHFTRLFYNRLFELNPSLAALFKVNMEEQGHKLMSTLYIVVSSLNRLESFIPAMHALGQRHQKYGVKPEHYEVVGLALLWSLKETLKKEYTAEVEEAWTMAYGFIAGTMKETTAVSLQS